MSSKKGTGQLTPEERQELENWKPRYLRLPVHALVEHQIKLAMAGVEDSIVIGPPGVGKTMSLQRAINDLRARESDRLLEAGDYMPAEIIYYLASVAKGLKTALVDLHEELFGTGVRVGAKFRTPQNLRDHVVEEVIRRNVRLICIDEAQFINSANLDLLRQVPDVARQRGHQMSLMLVGNEALRESLVEIGQMGQRFTGEIKFPRISRAGAAKFLPDFHPHVARLKQTTPAGAWKRLEADLLLAINGNMRRLVRILENANHLALSMGEPVTERVLRLAIEKLAEEG
jgi:type II secretory pathway predicted ATPase ExeA